MQEDTRGGYGPYDAFTANAAPPMYGTTGAYSPPYAGKPMFKPRKRLNIVAIWVSLFVPWTIFSGYFAFLSFGFHYNYPGIMGFFFAGGAIATFTCGYYAFKAIKGKMSSVSRESTWHVFIFLSMILAWILALILGSMNYSTYMVQYHQMMHLNEYHDVRPTTMRGSQYMDAGPVFFSNRSALDLSKSMGFMDLKQYCVAPITEGRVEPLESYDFWAIGTECCSVRQSEYRCENSHNTHIHGGLRLTNDGERPFFRLAVQQAEAAYNITANHPLFFRWVEDPLRVMKDWKVTVLSNYLFGVFGYFLFQVFILIIVALVFSRTG